MSFRFKTVALHLVASISLLASTCSIAHAQNAQVDMSTSVSMTLYHLTAGKNGQQLYLDRNGQSYPLPGAGCNDPKTLAVYTGSNGQRWYVDKTGKPIDLPPITPAAYTGQATYNQSGFSMDGQNYSNDGSGDNSTPQNVTINNDPTYNSNSSDDSGSYDAGVAAGVGAAVGALAGDALADSIDGLPYDTPLYVGDDGYPYYWGADGLRYPLATGLAGRYWWNNWRNNWNWYHHNVYDPGGRYYGQARQVAQDGHFYHPNHVVPGTLGDRMFNNRNMASSDIPSFDDHGFQPIHGPMDSRGADSGIERSDDITRGFANDLNRSGFGDRFGGGGFRGGGFSGGGFGGGFHGGGGGRR
jgi:hypothetical protein